MEKMQAKLQQKMLEKLLPLEATVYIKVYRSEGGLAILIKPIEEKNDANK